MTMPWLPAVLVLLACASCSAPLWRRPFQGEARIGNFFDHDIPRQFKDDNGRQVTFWGEQLDFIDGHSGYDFTLPEGTPVLAVTDAKVIHAGEGEPYYCPPLRREVVDRFVQLQVMVRFGTIFRVTYSHLSRVDVRLRQSVSAGQVLGLSGNTGCSTGPHLHFEVLREKDDGRWVAIDPYAYLPGKPDPWLAAGGEPSEWMWLPDQAPVLYREVSAPPNEHGSRSPLTITRLRWLGIDDDRNPNNEFVEVTLDPRFAKKMDLAGVTLSNNRGDTFRFPKGFVLTEKSATVRVYTGPGRDSATELYWGRERGIWQNRPEADCATLKSPRMVYARFYYGKDTCRVGPPS